MRTETASVRPTKLLLRCLAERQDGVWAAYCLDFSLGAQAATFDEAKAKLDAQIREYLHDVMVGEDAAYAGQLLRRRAPAGLWLKYWLYLALCRVTSGGSGLGGSRRLFSEVLPMIPAAC